IDALSDVDRLLAYDVEYAASSAVEANFRAGVADVDDDVADDLFQIDPGAGGDFAGDDGHAGLDQGLTGHAGVFVLGDDGVQYGIGNLVGDLVRVPFGHGLGGENRVFAHLAVSCYRWVRRLSAAGRVKARAWI